MAVLRVAEIVAVGSELLTPHRTDTNSLFLTARLNELGITVAAKRVVADREPDVRDAVRDALGRADLVVLTGGLGPTADDVTREAVAEALDLPLDEDAALLEELRARFASRGMTMAESNRRQAQVPRGAVPLANPNGTAPGLWIETGDRVVILLPGPPREAQPMIDGEIASRLSARTAGRRVRRRVVKLTGRSESLVDEIARPIYERFQAGDIPIVTTILATPGQIELHLSASGENVGAVDAALETVTQAVAGALAPFVFSVDGRSLEEVVGALLQARGQTIAVAESCTGGLVAGRLTEVPGSSAWVVGGTVAYANEVKINELGVPAELIATDGAVSEPVARAMAEGVRRRLGATIGLAVTGIAGPAGGSEAKPVGTVVFALAAGDGPAQARTVRFPGDRRTVRQHSTAAALDLVRRSLQ
jgi:nicotinamide-nucleotide amidase